MGKSKTKTEKGKERTPFFQVKEKAMEAVGRRAENLQYCSAELQNDRDVVMAAIDRGYHAYEFASPELQKDIKMARYAIHRDARALQFVRLIDISDAMARELVKDAVRANTDMYEYAGRFAGEADIAIEALRGNPTVDCLTSLNPSVYDNATFLNGLSSLVQQYGDPELLEKALSFGAQKNVGNSAMIDYMRHAVGHFSYVGVLPDSTVWELENSWPGEEHLYSKEEYSDNLSEFEEFWNEQSFGAEMEQLAEENKYQQYDGQIQKIISRYYDADPENLKYLAELDLEEEIRKTGDTELLKYYLDTKDEPFDSDFYDRSYENLIELGDRFSTENGSESRERDEDAFPEDSKEGVEPSAPEIFFDEEEDFEFYPPLDDSEIPEPGEVGPDPFDPQPSSGPSEQCNAKTEKASRSKNPSNEWSDRVRTGEVKYNGANYSGPSLDAWDKTDITVGSDEYKEAIAFWDRRALPDGSIERELLSDEEWRNLSVAQAKALVFSYNPMYLQFLPDIPYEGNNTDLSKCYGANDLRIVGAAVHLNGLAIQYASDELRNMVMDEKSATVSTPALEAVRNNPAAFRFVGPRARGDRSVVAEAVTKDGMLLRYADLEMSRDYGIVTTAIENNKDAVRFADKKFFTRNIDYALDLIEKDPSTLKKMAGGELADNLGFVLEAVKRNGLALEFASDRLRKNAVVVLNAIQQNGMAIRFADYSKINHRGFAKRAANFVPESVRFLSYKMKSLRDVVGLAIRRSYEAIRFAAMPIRSNKEMGLASVEQNGRSLEYLSPLLRGDADVVYTAVSQDGLALQFALSGLRNSEEVVLAAVEQNGLALQFAGEQQRANPDVVLAALEENYNAIAFASETLAGNEMFLENAVKIINSGREDAAKLAGLPVPKPLTTEQVCTELLGREYEKPKAENLIANLIQKAKTSFRDAEISYRTTGHGILKTAGKASRESKFHMKNADVEELLRTAKNTPRGSGHSDANEDKDKKPDYSDIPLGR